MIECYKLEKHKFSLGMIATAAIMSCVLCGDCLSGMGGPGEYLCIRCGDLLVSRQLNLTVVDDGETNGL